MKNDLEQFSRIVREYSPRMLSLALGIVGRRDEAEDVVQDALVKAYEKFGSWRGEGALSTWLYRIVYTTAVSRVRSRGRVWEDAVEPADPEAAQEEGYWEITEENIARMGRALELLPPLDRTLVTLFHIEGKSVKEVAAIVGESTSNVKTKLHRIRARLKKMMENDKNKSGHGT